MGDEDVPYELYDPCGVPGETAVKPFRSGAGKKTGNGREEAETDAVYGTGNGGKCKGNP